MTVEAKNREFLNPGDGNVSRLCHEPIVSVAVLMEMFMPYISSGQLRILLEYKAINAETNGDNVIAVTVENQKDREGITLIASYFIDATECGDLLPLTKTEYVTGAESQKDTKELHENRSDGSRQSVVPSTCDQYRDDNIWMKDRQLFRE